MSVRAIADMERGRTARPFRHSVHRLADALDLPGPDREQLERAVRAAAASILLTAGQDAVGTAPELRLLAPPPETGRSQGRVPGQGTACKGTVPRRGRARQETVPRQLPAPTVDFVGRTAELRALNGALTRRGASRETVPILAIVGTAGVGKTTLAVNWAHQITGQFPDGQLYVDMQGFDPSGEPLASADAIRGFLHALGQPSARVRAPAHAAAGQYRSLLAGRRVLIILDNTRDPEHVRPLLPGGPGCAVVVTSRNQLTGLVVADGAQPLFLDVLTMADASELLARRMGAQRLAAERQAAEELIALSGRLPLALAAVAAHAAASPGLTLRDLAADLRDGSRRLDVVETGEPATSLRAKLTGSYRLLTDPAARMLQLLGLRSGPGFSASAAARLAGIPVSQARDLLRELARASLVTEHPADRFTFHAFLRSFAAECASAADGDFGPGFAVE